MLASKFIPNNQALLISMLILALLSSACSTAPKATDPVASASSTPLPTAEPALTQVPPPAPVDPATEIKPTAPKQYVVVKGDTLWDISSKFLQRPWYWPEIWQVNPQINNPHLIYPGDIISLVYVGGKPQLQITGGPRFVSSTRLSPEIRYEALDKNENALPAQAIRQFIVRPRIVSEAELNRAPYLVGSQDDRLIYGTDDVVYVRHLTESDADSRYNVYRPGKPLRDPDTDELLGYEAIRVGDAQVLKAGDPATIKLTRTEREALLGDRLLPPDNADDDQTYYPRAPSSQVKGRVVSLFNAISQIGQYQVGVLNLGARNGIEKGDVLAALRAGRTVRDPFTDDALNRKVTLPSERSGTMMVFRVFDKLSYGLVMDTQRPIHIGDVVVNP